MTTNFRKIWGILFLAAMTVVSVPSGAWGQKLGDQAKIQDAPEFLEDHGQSDWAKLIRDHQTADKSNSIILCGQVNCDLKTSICVKCSVNHSYGSTLNDASGNVGNISQTNVSYRCLPKDTDVSSLNESHSNVSLWRKMFTGQYDDTTTTCHQVTSDELSSDYSTTYSGFMALNDIEDKDCLKGSDTNTYCLSINGKDITVNYGNVEGGFKGCEVLPVKLYNQRKCFFCPLFKVLFTAADSMAKTSFDKLGTAFKSLIGIGLALWIAVQTLTHVSSLTKQDAPKFLGGLIKQSAKFLIAFLLLANSGEIYRLGVNPILQAGLKFGGELVSGNVSVSDNTIIEYNKIADPGATYFSTSKGSLYVDIAIFISKVQYEIAFMQAVGSSLLCIGGHGMFAPTGGKLGFGDGFQMAIQGLLLVGFGLLLSLAFAFYLIDAVVQLGIVGALMPFLIACWPFKITSSYTGKGMQILLNSFFVFVFIGLVIRVNIDLIDAGIKNTVTTASTETSASTDANKDNKDENAEKALGGLLPIYNAVNNQDIDTLKELTDISTIGFLILVVCCLFGFKLSGKAEELAGKMAGGAISGIGSSIGTMATSAAKGAALKTTAPIRKAAWDKTKDMGKSAYGSVKNRLSGKKGTAGTSGRAPAIVAATASSAATGTPPPAPSSPAPVISASGNSSTVENKGTPQKRPNRGSNPTKGTDPRKAGKRRHAQSMQQHARQAEMRKKIKLGSGKSRQQSIKNARKKGKRKNKRK